MPEDTHLVCTACSAAVPASAPVWRCECGGLLDIAHSLCHEPGTGSRPGMWRYRDAIPVDSDSSIVSFGEGFTPLVAQEIAGRVVHIKHEHVFPTGSYKDRGASVLVSKVKELGVREVVEDSSGNAGCAIAAYCAAAGITCHIYVPESTSPAKLAQIAAYGAVLHRVPGSRSDTARAAMDAAESLYYASHSWNPFFFQGTKTIAYEVVEQLGGCSPDAFVVPAGNGTLLLGASLGFAEMLRAGHIRRLPRIVAVQAENCAPLARAFEAGEADAVEIEDTQTLAEGIAIPSPVRARQILAAVRESGGSFVTVSEEQIAAAFKRMCLCGHYIEPTSAATIAGVELYVADRPEDEVVVSMFTGHGLKSTEKIMHILDG